MTHRWTFIAFLLLHSTIAMTTMTTKAAAHIDWQNICPYSGDQRQEIENALKKALVGKPVEQFDHLLGGKWTPLGKKTPSAIFDTSGEGKRNSDGISFVVHERLCHTGKNTTRFMLGVELKNDVITDAYAEVFYIDKDFSLRREKLYWRRYDRREDLDAALQSIADRVKSPEEWQTILAEAGFMEATNCEIEKHNFAIYRRPILPFGSIGHRMGANHLIPGQPTKIFVDRTNPHTPARTSVNCTPPKYDTVKEH